MAKNKAVYRNEVEARLTPLQAHILEDDEPTPPPIISHRLFEERMITCVNSTSIVPHSAGVKRAPKWLFPLAMSLAIALIPPIVSLYCYLVFQDDPEGWENIKRLFRFIANGGKL